MTGLTRAGAALTAVLLLIPVLISAAAGGDSGSAAAPSPVAVAAVPPSYLTLYRAAAATCPGLPWTVLAAVGTVETDNGRSTAAGVHSGANSAGAEGPMQFEPATFAEYDQPTPPGGATPPSPYDPPDAVYAAARDLCANGGRHDQNIHAAVFAYNHADWYVTKVLTIAATYATQPSTSLAGSGALQAVRYAEQQTGIPYEWGGDGPAAGDTGFDCSGLTQAAYASAGILLPRTAQTQYSAGPQLPAGTPLQPGDLIFFGASPTDITHVGIYLAAGQMIDAPHTGALVRTEPVWTSDLIGATRPAARATT